MTKVNLSATARRIRDLAELNGAAANMTRTEFVHAARPDGHTRVRTRSRPLHVEAVYGPAGRERAAVALVAGVDRGIGAYADHYTLAPLVVTSVINGGGYAPGAREELAGGRSRRSGKARPLATRRIRMSGGLTRWPVRYGPRGRWTA